MRDGLLAKYGQGSAEFGSYKRPTRVISTGVLALDLALETGGWTLGDLHTIYGPPDIGKSSSLGLAAICSAQSQGLVAAIIAMEPNFSPEWAERNGVDPERVLILRPSNGEEAFAMLIDVVGSGLVDLVLFDSVGAVIAKSEMEADGKAKQGGQSGLITRGVKAVAPLAYKYDCGVIFINQIRDNMRAQIPGAVDMPGGHALKHACITRVRLRPTSNRFTEKRHGDDVIVGREIACIIERNKQGEGTNRKALFNYWQADTLDGKHKVGIDTFEDIINTSVTAGVIQRGGAYYTFPPGMNSDKKMQGFDKVKDYLGKHPEEMFQIRELVLATIKDES